VLWLSACDGGETVSLENYQAALTKAFCDAFIRCDFAPDEATCRQAFSKHAPAPRFEALVEAGRIVFDGAKAAECIANLAAPDYCTLTGHLRFCSPYEGQVSAGAACSLDWECRSRTCDTGGCDQLSTCCEGTCAGDSPIVGVGGNCSALFSECVAGATCVIDPETFTRTCRPIVGPGGTCSATGECSSGEWCPWSGTTRTAQCVPAAKRGQDCIPEGLPCDSLRDLCDPATHKCVARRTPGEPCAGPVDCVNYAVCDGTSGKCVRKANLGEACGTFMPCLQPLECRDGTCAPGRGYPACP
jgi:hypothetical protein